MVDLVEMVGKHENHQVDYTFMVNSMDNKLKELTDHLENKQLDAIERIMELRQGGK